MSSFLQIKNDIQSTFSNSTFSEKVWDRNTRKDFVFGSAEGKGLTIDEFIEQTTAKDNKT